MNKVSNTWNFFFLLLIHISDKYVRLVIYKPFLFFFILQFKLFSVRTIKTKSTISSLLFFALPFPPILFLYFPRPFLSSISFYSLSCSCRLLSLLLHLLLAAGSHFPLLPPFQFFLSLCLSAWDEDGTVPSGGPPASSAHSCPPVSWSPPDGPRTSSSCWEDSPGTKSS